MKDSLPHRLCYLLAALNHFAFSIFFGVHSSSVCSPQALLVYRSTSSASNSPCFLLNVSCKLISGFCAAYGHKPLPPAAPPCSKVSWAAFAGWFWFHQNSFSQENREATRLHQLRRQSNPLDCYK